MISEQRKNLAGLRKADCRIVVLNFNGRDLLRDCLPSIVEAASKSLSTCAVTVLDNQSSDDSRAVTKAVSDEIEYVESASNRVFCSYNNYLASISEKWVILLNNDIRVDKNFIDPLLEPFKKDPRLFFTTPKTLGFYSHEYEGSLSKLQFQRGLIWGSARFKGHEIKIDRPHLTMQCGFGAFERNLFLELGGYDDLFLPGTMEDADLCFRAYRQGFTGLYVPQSVVYHVGQASFKKAFGVSGIRKLNRRNLYLFIWKNIRDPWLLAEHFVWMPAHLLKYLLLGQWDFLRGLAEAFIRLPQAWRRRENTRNEHSVVPDKKIFALSKSL